MPCDAVAGSPEASHRPKMYVAPVPTSDATVAPPGIQAGEPTAPADQSPTAMNMAELPRWRVTETVCAVPVPPLPVPGPSEPRTTVRCERYSVPLAPAVMVTVRLAPVASGAVHCTTRTWSVVGAPAKSVCFVKIRPDADGVMSESIAMPCSVTISTTIQSPATVVTAPWALVPAPATRSLVVTDQGVVAMPGWIHCGLAGKPPPRT